MGIVKSLETSESGLGDKRDKKRFVSHQSKSNFRLPKQHLPKGVLKDKVGVRVVVMGRPV